MTNAQKYYAIRQWLHDWYARDVRMSILYGYVATEEELCVVDAYESLLEKYMPLYERVRVVANSGWHDVWTVRVDEWVDDLVETWHPALCQRYRDIVTPWHAAGCPGPMPADVRDTTERMRAVECAARYAVAARERAELREFERVCAAAVRSGVRRSREMAVSDMEHMERAA